MKFFELSILFPAFNEGNNLLKSLEEVSKVEILKKKLHEIIIIDDHSNDDTFEWALICKKMHKNVVVVRNQKNMGLGGSYKEGLKVARGEYITWVPADNSHDARSLEDAYESVGHADMIIPVPSNPKVRSKTRRIISNLFTILVNLVTSNKIKYYNGLTIHKKKLVESIDIVTNGFGFQAEIIVKLLQKGATYKYVETMIQERSEGVTNAFKLKNVIQVVCIIVLLAANKKIKK